MNDWQTWAALAVVAVTGGVFLRQALRKKKPGCGTGCGCAGSKPKPLPVPPQNNS